MQCWHARVAAAAARASAVHGACCAGRLNALPPALLQVPAQSWNFPDRQHTVTGAAISDYLRGSKEQDDAAIHLLFSANRWEKRCAAAGRMRRLRTLRSCTSRSSARAPAPC